MEQATAKRHARRIELWQVHLYNVVLPDQLCSDQSERGRDDTLAQTKGHRHANNTDAVHPFFARQFFFILGGHHSDLVPAIGKRPRQALGVDCQAGGVRTVISENGKNFHRTGRL